MISYMLTQKLSRPATIQRSPTFMGGYQYTYQPFPPSMHPVILAASVACDVSAFELPHLGKKARHDTIVSLSAQIQRLTDFWDWMLLAFVFSFPLIFVA
jgi:hypothetical protein